MKRIDDIEVLRAWAILLVLVEHSTNLFAWNHPLLRWLQPRFYGGSGVDLFFVISGFVIARGLAPRIRESGRLAARFGVAATFWLRRAWRLFPAAWLWLALPLLAARWFNDSGVFGTWHGNFAAARAGFFFYANYWFRVSRDVPALDSATFPYWSLSLEEQFYLLLPLLLILFGRRFPLFAAGVVAYCLTSRGHGIFVPVFRPSGLLLGTLLAFWEPHRSFERAQAFVWRWQAPFRPLATILFLAIPFVRRSGLGGYGHAYVEPVCALAVFLAAGDRGWFLPRQGFRQILIWVGTRSYSLYLVHVPVYFAIRESWHRIAPGSQPGQQYPLALFALGVVAVAVLAEATFRWVETPARRRSRRLGRRREDAPDARPDGADRRETPPEAETVIDRSAADLERRLVAPRGAELPR